MPKRLPEETRELIKELYEKGLPINEIAKRTNVSYSTVWGYTQAEKRGFKSYSDYQEHLAKERGFKSYSEYQEHLAKERGFNSYREYQKHWAKERGFSSFSEYQNHIERKRQQKPKNKDLSQLIQIRLEEMNKSRAWLAKQIGVSREMTSLYYQGKSMPKSDLLEKVYLALGVRNNPDAPIN